jgi:NodT family efflux transporter outer membrane factor (OMF) lipoprotein
MNRQDLKVRLRSRVLMFFGIVASLAGCVDLTPPPNMTPKLPAAWSNRTDPKDTRPPVDLTRWWTGFDDATLDRLVREATAENLSLKQAASRVLAARAGQQAAVAGLLPSITGAATAQGEQLFGNDRINNVALPVGVPGVGSTGQPVVLGAQSGAYYQTGFDAAWELPLFGRGEATRKAAAGALGAAVADEAAAQVSLVAEVARNYIVLRANQQRQLLLTASLATERQLALLVEVRWHAGLASELDLARARNAGDQVATRLAPVEGEIRGTLQRLATLRGGTAYDPALLAPTPLPTPPTASLAVVPAELLRLRPDILKAEQLVEENAGAVGIAVANLYPQLTLGGSISAVGSFNGGVLPGPVGMLSGGPAVTIPLLDWGAQRAQANARNAELAASVLSYRETVLVGIEEVETGLAHVAAARRQAEAARNEVVSAEQALGYAELLYGRGLTPLSDRLEVERSALDARLDVVAAVQSEALAAIALYKAVGGAMPGKAGP